jgi:hypothetical protein
MSTLHQMHLSNSLQFMDSLGTPFGVQIYNIVFSLLTIFYFIVFFCQGETSSVPVEQS